MRKGLLERDATTVAFCRLVEEAKGQQARQPHSDFPVVVVAVEVQLVARLDALAGGLRDGCCLRSSRSNLFTFADRHDRLPSPRHCAAVLGRVQVLHCVPPLRAPSATWTRLARGG
jgi:hypothetical protein